MVWILISIEPICTDSSEKCQEHDEIIQIQKLKNYLWESHFLVSKVSRNITLRL